MRLALLSITAALAFAQSPVVRHSTLQAGTPQYCRSTTANDTYTCTLTPALTAYTTGGCLLLNPDTGNTLTATISPDGLAAKSILNRAVGALATGDITANAPITICYDGTQYIIQGDGGGGGGSNPGGSGTELQYRGGPSTFSALTNSSIPNAGELRLGTTPNASATRAVITVGTAAIASGSANGNMLGINAPSGFTGNLIQAEVNGAGAFYVDSAGGLTASSFITAGGTVQAGDHLQVDQPFGTPTVRNVNAGVSAKLVVIGSGGVGSGNYLALRNSSGGTPTDQLRINGDQKAVMIGQTVNTTSLSAMTTYFSDRTATTGDTRVAIEGGAGQAADLFAIYAYNATPLAGTKHIHATSAGVLTMASAPVMTALTGLLKGNGATALSVAAFSDIAALTVPNVSNVTAQTTSQSTVTVATAPTAGNYRLNLIANQNALCTTGNGTVSFTFNWTDAGNARSLTTGNMTLSTAQQTSGYLSGLFPIWVNSGNVTYTSTVTACATGTASYDVHVALERIQ